MRTLLLIACLFFVGSAEAQYYLRGEIRDENKNPLANVKILLHSNSYLYYSGSLGGFGIQIPQRMDSVTISAEGFQVLSMAVDAAAFQSIVLKPLFPPEPPQKMTLLSATKNLRREDIKGWTIGGETYSSLVENDFVTTSRFPETGFAINIDKASYSNIRRFLNMGSSVPPDAVRIEEMLNYFNLDYTPPAADSVFSTRSFLSDCPWKQGSQLLMVQVSARKIDLDKVPPANLVFLIDISGSMDMPNRLPLLKSAFRLLVNNLRPKDTVSIVVYGSTVGVWLKPTPGNEKNIITKAIEDLYPGGPTPGEAGIQAAYRLASNQYIHGGNNRVILATDGDFNVGETTEEALEKLIVLNKQRGIYLTCLGVGMGNYKDSKLQVLAEKGNGNFAYLDNIKEAEKVLLQEFTQTIYSVADDAYLQIRFNPDLVKEYRLIGFDNKMKALSDSVSEIEGGEVGSGHSLMAVFELTPEDAPTGGQTGLLAEGTIHYRLPHDTLQRKSGFECRINPVSFATLPAPYRFAASVAMFGGLLRKSRFIPSSGWKEAIEIANGSFNPQDELQKEYIILLDKARKIYKREKKATRQQD